MTREHKLALIVGFSLILLVGVLISDHLSRARQAQVGPVTTHEAQVGEANFPAPIDPIKAIENAPMPANVPQLVPDRQLAGGGTPAQPAGAGGFVPEPSGQGPLTQAFGGGATPPGATPPVHEPTSPARVAIQIPTREMHIPKANADQDLIREVLAQGGQVRERGGVIEIIPPPALVQTQKPGAAGKAAVQLVKAETNPPASPAAPAPATLKTYTILKGDNLSKVAAREYGDGKLWAKLAKFNGIADEDGTVRLGQSIKLPPKDVLLGKPAPAKPDLVSPSPSATPAPGGPRELGQPVKPARTELASAKPTSGKDLPKNKMLAKPEPVVTVTVKKGETLGDVARRALGSSKRWPELAEFNKIDDEDSIAAGTVLKVPPMRG